MDASAPPHSDRRWVLACTLLAAVLRLYHLGHQSLWVDEMISLQLATYASGAEFWHGLLEDIHGPLTSVFLHGWTRLGETDGWLRLLYALPAIATIPLAYLLGRRLFGRAAGRITCLALALSPMHVWYAQELRNYTWLVLGATAALVLFVRVWDGEGSRRTWVALALVLALAILTNYSLGFLLIGLTVAALLRRPWQPRFLLAWGGTLLFVGLVFLPWFVDWFGRIGGERLFVNARSPLGLPLREASGFSPAGLPYALWTFVYGYSLGPPLLDLHLDRSASTLLPHVPVLVPGLLAAAAALVLGLQEAHARGRLLLVLTILLVPLVLTSYLAVREIKTFHPRYMLASLPVVFAMLGAAWSRRGIIARGSGILAGALMLVSLGQHYFDPAYGKEDSRRAAQIVRSEEKPGDTVVLIYAHRPFRHYYAQDGGGHARLLQVHKRLLQTDEDMRAHVAAATAEGGRVWLVLTRWWDVAPEERIRAIFAESLTEVRRWEVQGVKITLYEGVAT